MALGGGTFTTQNKILPGTYYNFVSKPVVTLMMGERGVVAMPIALKWGDIDEVKLVTAEDFITDTLKIFGYDYNDANMLELREVFKHASKVYLYNLGDTGASEATSTYGKAKKKGSRGNDLKMVIEKNVDNTSMFDVTLYLGTTIVHEQTVASIADLSENDFVEWSTTELAVSAGVSFTGGVDGTVNTTSYQNALNAFESYEFNVLICPDASASAVYAAYTKRMRDDRGIKFQTVIPNTIAADFEGVIQMVPEQPAVSWVAGAIAGCAINESCTNLIYDGEKTIPTTHTQVELENLIKTGVFAFHRVYDKVRVLVDINSLVTYTEKKGKDFSSNQVVRVNDQCANDISKIFNTKYLGKIQNDENGRVSFWNDIVTHRRELETLRAIETYDSGALIVSKGKDKFSVVVTESYTPVGAMEKLYFTTEIN